MANTITCPDCGATNIEGADECRNCGSDLRTVDLPRPASQIERTIMHEPLTALTLTPIHAVSPETSLETAVHALTRQKVDILEVVEDGHLIGLLSLRDIVNRVGPDYAGKLQQPVRQFMTPNPETLPPDAPITFAINKMDVGGYRHVPVVQDGRTVGVASAGDVIAYLWKRGREQVATAGVTTSHGVSSPAKGTP